jgi:hypothetical protein
MSTSRGSTSEKAGTNKTSSNVKPSMRFLGVGFVAMCKDKRGGKMKSLQCKMKNELYA